MKLKIKINITLYAGVPHSQPPYDLPVDVTGSRICEAAGAVSALARSAEQ
jgi:hypothetical protein